MPSDATVIKWLIVCRFVPWIEANLLILAPIKNICIHTNELRSTRELSKLELELIDILINQLRGDFVEIHIMLNFLRTAVCKIAMFLPLMCLKLIIKYKLGSICIK
jgi:hypothetical protein